MTKVTIDPGVCGFITRVEANSEDGEEVILKVRSGCEPVRKMFEELGDTFDSYGLCLVHPGEGPLYAYASKKFPVHCACPIIPGVIKAAEVECSLALPKEASIKFE